MEIIEPPNGWLLRVSDAARQLFFLSLSCAQREPKPSWDIGGEVQLQRGEWMMSFHKLSETLNLKRPSIRRGIRQLEEASFHRTRRASMHQNAATIFTILDPELFLPSEAQIEGARSRRGSGSKRADRVVPMVGPQKSHGGTQGGPHGGPHGGSPSEPPLYPRASTELESKLESDLAADAQAAGATAPDRQQQELQAAGAQEQEAPEPETFLSLTRSYAAAAELPEAPLRAIERRHEQIRAEAEASPEERESFEVENRRKIEEQRIRSEREAILFRLESETAAAMKQLLDDADRENDEAQRIAAAKAAREERVRSQWDGAFAKLGLTRLAGGNGKELQS